VARGELQALPRRVGRRRAGDDRLRHAGAGPDARPDSYRRYLFAKINGKWLQTDTDAGDAKALDTKKYAYSWDKP